MSSDDYVMTASVVSPHYPATYRLKQSGLEILRGVLESTGVTIGPCWAMRVPGTQITLAIPIEHLEAVPAIPAMPPEPDPGVYRIGNAVAVRLPGSETWWAGKLYGHGGPPNHHYHWKRLWQAFGGANVQIKPLTEQ